MTFRSWSFVLVLSAGVATSLTADDGVDLTAVHRIKSEAFGGSKVMDHMFFLTDVNGPRLTGSPGYAKAADWAIGALKSWGVDSARREKWGTFGRGWSITRFAASMREPVFATLHGVPLAWSAGTNGPVTAEVVSAPLFAKWERMDANDPEKLAARIARYAVENKGKLRGKIVLIEADRDFELPKKAAGERYDDAKLNEEAAAPDPAGPLVYDWPIKRLPSDPKDAERLMNDLPDEVAEEYYARMLRIQGQLARFLSDEGVVGVFSTDRRGDGAIVFAEQAASWETGATAPPASIALAPEGYSRLARLVAKGVPTKVELDLGVAFHDESPDGFNVVAEIPGGRKKDEVVMLGAHLDSWHGGTGAADNAAGSAVVIEAFRILKTLKLPMDRTVRLALWGGEEQGLFGSRGYVKEHFGDPVTMALKPEHARLAAYFNVDNGSGKIRGVYLQGNDMVRPIFEGWLAPFRDHGATTLSIRDTGGTDHLSFDAVGLPGFQFIQDPLDYGTRTHHSHIDVYDHVQPADLMQASAIVASFVFNAASRPDALPRKPLPKPLPPRKE